MVALRRPFASKSWILIDEKGVKDREQKEKQQNPDVLERW